SNSASGTRATRTAVSFWSFERPASRAACARETVGAPPPFLPGRPPCSGRLICAKSSPHRRIARAWMRSASRALRRGRRLAVLGAPRVVFPHPRFAAKAVGVGQVERPRHRTRQRLDFLPSKPKAAAGLRPHLAV